MNKSRQEWGSRLIQWRWRLRVTLYRQEVAKAKARSIHEAVRSIAATHAANVWRRHHALHHFGRAKEAAATIQAVVRQHRASRQFAAFVATVIYLQSVLRTHLSRGHYAQCLQAATRVQALARQRMILPASELMACIVALQLMSRRRLLNRRRLARRRLALANSLHCVWQRRRAALCIQSLARRRAACITLAARRLAVIATTRLSAAIRLQGISRCRMARRAAQHRRRAAMLICTTGRRVFAVATAGATIRRCCRGYLGRRRARLFRAALEATRLARGALARRRTQEGRHALRLERAGRFIVRLGRGYLGRKRARYALKLARQRFRCRNCGVVEPDGTYCKLCGYRRAQDKDDDRSFLPGPVPALFRAQRTDRSKRHSWSYSQPVDILMPADHLGSPKSRALFSKLDDAYLRGLRAASTGYQLPQRPPHPPLKRRPRRVSASSFDNNSLPLL